MRPVSRADVRRSAARSAVQCSRILLNRANLRATRQRLALLDLLLMTGDRPFTAEAVYQEALSAGRPLPRSTICAALRQLMQAGLVGKLTVDNSRKTWFSVSEDVVTASDDGSSIQIE